MTVSFLSTNSSKSFFILSKSSRSLPKAILSHFSSLTLSLKRRLHLSQNSTSPLQYLQGLILPELFVEVLDAVEAVLEMVEAIACRVGRRGAAQ